MIWQVWVDMDVSAEFLDEASARSFAWDVICTTLDTVVAVTWMVP
jgi:hypothetical protein